MLPLLLRERIRRPREAKPIAWPKLVRGSNHPSSSARPLPIFRLLGQHRAHALDQFGFLHRDLRHAGLAPSHIVGDFAREALALDQVLDLDLAGLALGRALDDGERRATADGVWCIGTFTRTRRATMSHRTARIW